MLVLHDFKKNVKSACFYQNIVATLPYKVELNMAEQDEQLKALTEMRDLMNRSSRFLSLSGLSGIFAGSFALCGAWFAQRYIEATYSRMSVTADYYYIPSHDLFPRIFNVISRDFFLFADAALVIILSLAAVWFFSGRKAKKAGVPLWDRTTWRAIANLAIPLATGGIFCFALLMHGIISFIVPATMIFYGLALLNTSKYTLNDIRYLGLCEILLGLISMLFQGYGLIFWSIGFGLLHIFYGAVMYFKYERR